MVAVEGWLKRALQEATDRVANWPEWKRRLQEAMDARPRA